MSVREKAPSILTEEGARRLTARIRDALSLADDLLVQAWEGRAWEALNYPTWGAYVEEELPRYRLVKALPPEERAEEWAEQVRAGLSMGAVADGAGVGKATVSRALSGKVLPETATGLDGKVRSTRQATVPPRNGSPTSEERYAAAADVRKWQVVACYVAAHQATGATCLEFERAQGWRHGSASAAFHAAEKKGHIRRTGVFRESYAAYVVNYGKMGA